MRSGSQRHDAVVALDAEGRGLFVLRLGEDAGHVLAEVVRRQRLAETGKELWSKEGNPTKTAVIGDTAGYVKSVKNGPKAQA